MFDRSCLLCFILSVSAVFAEDWKEFRGPQGTGISETATPPVRWSETENITWKIPVAGRGWSSPVVVDQEIWLTTATENGKEMSFLCLKLDNGQILHEKLLFTNAEPREIHVTNSYASCTPVIDGERIYLHYGSYGTACLNRQTAEVLWERRDFPCHHWRGPGSSPIIFEDLLILHYDGFDYQYAVAVNKMTGETVWKKDRLDYFNTDDGDQKKAYGTPAVYEIDGQLQLISPYAKTTVAYEPRTGKELWWVRYEQHSTANRPLYDGKRLFIGTGFGKGSILGINPQGAAGDVTDTHVAWVQNRTMPSKPSPLLIDGRIYTIADKIGVASCIDIETGELVWQERIGGTFSASPVYADGHIYLCDEDGKTTVIKPGDSMTVVAENLLEAGCMATPAPVGKSLILRTRSHLYNISNK